jgi:hypothetical protein
VSRVKKTFNVTWPRRKKRQNGRKNFEKFRDVYVAHLKSDKSEGEERKTRVKQWKSEKHTKELSLKEEEVRVQEVFNIIFVTFYCATLISEGSWCERKENSSTGAS